MNVEGASNMQCVNQPQAQFTNADSINCNVTIIAINASMYNTKLQKFPPYENNPRYVFISINLL